MIPTKACASFHQSRTRRATVGLPATCDDSSAIVILGGHGTVHRHLTQRVKLRWPVLVVLRGSGNDFAQTPKIRGVRDALGDGEFVCQTPTEVGVAPRER